MAINYGAYMIYHPASKKAYVGSATNINSRGKEHLRLLRNNGHFNPTLQKAFNDDPVIEYSPVPLSDREIAYDFEQSMLDEFLPSGLLFNTAPDARHPHKGIKHRPETIQRMSDVKKGKIFSDEHCKNLSIAHAGKAISATQSSALDLGRLARMRRVSLDGAIYDSLTLAGNALGISPDTIRNRINRENSIYTNWFYI